MAVSGVAMVWSGCLVSGLFTIRFLCSYELVLMTGGDTLVTSCVLETLESALVSTSLIMWRIADRIVFVGSQHDTGANEPEFEGLILDFP